LYFDEENSQASFKVETGTYMTYYQAGWSEQLFLQMLVHALAQRNIWRRAVRRGCEGCVRNGLRLLLQLIHHKNVILTQLGDLSGKSGKEPPNSSQLLNMALFERYVVEEEMRTLSS
jgi:hypothetical protein